MSKETWCPACEGRGNAPCPWCAMSDDDLRTECFRCDGDGRVECDDCDGTGKRDAVCLTCLHPWRWHVGWPDGCGAYSDDDVRCGCRREETPDA